MKLNEIAYKKALLEELKDGKENLEVSLHIYQLIHYIASLNSSVMVAAEALANWRYKAKDRKFRYY